MTTIIDRSRAAAKSWAARDAARIDAGSKLAVNRNVALFGGFDGEFSGRGRMYAGKGGVQIDW
jgi:uncharacterized protein with beta-barrel porin domain